ncbi:MAG: leucine-rich repeat protein [Clostridia bacterium]|nr:leucine-rich repeat protein [Clostridia bacterium]
MDTMKKRMLPALLVFALILGCIGLSAPSARAEEERQAYADGSAYVLQAGGWLPAVRGRVPRGDMSALEQTIYDGLMARQSSIDISQFDVSTEDIGPIYWGVLNDHPELFFVDSGFGYGYSSAVTNITPQYNTEYTDADVAAYQGVVQRILGMMDSGWSDVEKALFLHDYLVTHCEYDLSYNRYNAHDALVVGSAVCQGYALAYNDLCNRSGIRSQVISSEAINHAWNLITLGGENFYVDCTWDDPSNHWYEARCEHEHFLLGRDSFSAGHNNSTDWVNGTVNVYNNVASSTRYENAWWQEVKTAVARIGAMGAYTLGNDTTHIYLRNMSSGEVNSLSLQGSARWPVWDQPGYTWDGNNSSVAAANGSFYFTLPTEIWSLSLTGDMRCAYAMTEDERAQGYLYGIVNDGGALYYNIGTELCNTTFTRAAFEPGPLTGESEGFGYQLLDNGTVSIIGCDLTGEVVIPEMLDGFTVSNLAAELFYGREDITAVSIPATVTSFGEDPEDNDWDYVFSYCYGLARIDVEAENPTFASVDGVLYSKDLSTLIHYPCGRGGQVYHVSAETLCCTSFAGCQNLRFLCLDDPDCWWYTYTFNAAPGLTVFYLPGGASEEKAAGEEEQGRVQDGTEGNLWCALESAEAICPLPEELQVIEEEAFRGTQMPYLTAPAGCQRIEAHAFADSALRYIRVSPDTAIEEGAFDSAVVVDFQ